MSAPPGANPAIPGVVDAVEVGRGGFAVVYRGEQPEFRRQVAAKVLTVDLDERARLRFERECQALGSLSDHPGIVTVYSAGYTGEGRPYLLMPFMPGGSYEDVIRDTGPLAWAQVLDLGVQLCDALAAAHAEGVLHRDLKPANVLRSRHGRPVLADFGIARVAGSRHTTNDTGSITGSVHFMAPELIDGQEPSVATDVYALGATLYALAAGRPAFGSDTDHSIVPVLHRILTRDPDPLPDVPDAVERVLRAAMAKQPEDRTPTALALGRALQDAQRASGLRVTALDGGNEHGGEEHDGDEERSPGPDAPAVTSGPSGPHDPGATVTGVPHLASPSHVRDATPVEQSAQARSGGRRRVVAGALLAVVLAGVAAALLLRPGDEGGDVALASSPTAFGDGTPLQSELVGSLADGAEVEGVVTAGTADLYTIELDAGVLLRARVLARTDLLDPTLALFGPDGEELTTDDDSGAADGSHDPLLDWYAAEAGTYVLAVAGYGATEDAGAYEVLADVRTPGGIDGPVDGFVEEYGLAAYTIEVESGRRLVLIARSGELDVAMVVLSPSGSLTEDDDSGGDGDALIEVDGTEGGAYLVVVGAADEGDAGHFTLEPEIR